MHPWCLHALLLCLHAPSPLGVSIQHPSSAAVGASSMHPSSSVAGPSSYSNPLVLPYVNYVVSEQVVLHIFPLRR